MSFYWNNWSREYGREVGITAWSGTGRAGLTVALWWWSFGFYVNLPDKSPPKGCA